MHRGTDFAAPGTIIMAPGDGIVKKLEGGGGT